MANKYKTLKTEVAVMFKTKKPEYLKGVEETVTGQKEARMDKYISENRFHIKFFSRRVEFPERESVVQGNEVAYGH